jgi:two-component system chemotaxis sensor kinase CheA
MSAFTLDDVATLLLQLEPEDRDDFARAREQLADLAFGNKVSIAAQPLVAGAMRALKPLAEGVAPDPAGAFAKVCALLEQAMAIDAAPPGRPAAAPPAQAAPAAPAPAAPAGDRLPADLDLELLSDFLAESRECLTGSEAALLDLERRPDDVEAVNTVFRAFHTVKGTSAFLGLDRVSAFAHEAESLLARVREGAFAYTSACADLALRATDMLKALLGAVEATLRADGPGGALALPDGYQPLVDAIVAYDGSSAAPAAQRAVAAPAVAAAPAAVAAPDDARPAEERRLGDRRLADDRRQGDRRQGAAEADQFVRVRTERLDQLIDMVGELVIAQSMITGDAALATGLAGAPAAASAPAAAPPPTSARRSPRRWPTPARSCASCRSWPWACAWCRSRPRSRSSPASCAT